MERLEAQAKFTAAIRTISDRVLLEGIWLLNRHGLTADERTVSVALLDEYERRNGEEALDDLFDQLDLALWGCTTKGA